MKILLILILLTGCVTRSPLIKEDIPDTCKLFLDCMYYNTKDGHGECGPFGDACRKTLIYNQCQNEDYRKQQACIDKLM